MTMVIHFLKINVGFQVSYSDISVKNGICLINIIQLKVKIMKYLCLIQIWRFI